MAQSLLPGWIRDVARFNPVDWAVVGSRSALGTGADWGLVAQRIGLLAALAVACATFATSAFRAYRRSV